MPSIERGAASVHYVTSGQRELDGKQLPVLTLLHGAGGDALTFWQNVPHFSSDWKDGEGFFVISVSVRGWGASRIEQQSDFSWQQLAGDVVAVLDAEGVRKTAVLGHSMGGFVAVRLAVEAPDRVERLILDCSAFGFKDKEGDEPLLLRYLDAVMRHQDAGPVAAAMKQKLAAAQRERRSLDRPPMTHWKQSPFFRQQPNLMFLAVKSAECNTQVAALGLHSALLESLREGAVTTTDFRTRYQGPVRLVATEDDPMAHWEAAEYLAQAMGGDTGVTVMAEGAWHMPHWTQPEEWNRMVEALLKE